MLLKPVFRDTVGSRTFDELPPRSLYIEFIYFYIMFQIFQKATFTQTLTTKLV